MYKYIFKIYNKSANKWKKKFYKIQKRKKKKKGNHTNKN